MKRTVAVFLAGIMAGSITTGLMSLAAGDVYDYHVLRPYICERHQREPGLYWTVQTVPDQENPCFVRAVRWPYALVTAR